MGKNVQHIKHQKSRVVANGAPKLPQASSLEFGELAINYAEGFETISMKSDSGTVKTFSSDEVYTSKKLGELFVDGGRFSSSTVSECMAEKERVIAASLNDLEDKISALTESIAQLQALESSLTQSVTELQQQEQALSGSITSLQSSASTISGSVTSLSTTVDTVSGNVNTVSGDVATLSGVVNSVSGTVDTVSGDVTTLSGAVESVYDMIGDGFTGETITHHFEDTEYVISASLNDLNNRVTALENS